MVYKGKIHIRSDGNTQIGLGHLVRCMALSHMLKQEFSINFVCKYAPEIIIKEIEEAGFSFTRIIEEVTFLTNLNANEIVVVDHYGLDSNYQKKIKKKGCKLVCIDDLHEKIFYADLIINHAPNIHAKVYRAQPYTQFALGLDYVLLRSVFLEAAKQNRAINKVNTVFICFGGSDIRNLTKQTLELVLNFQKFERIVVVIGAAYQYKAELELIILKASQFVDLYYAVDASQMADLMKASDIAIVPSSGILLEALSVGCKVISGIYVDNQKLLYAQYKRAKGFVDAGDFSTANLNRALNNIVHEPYQITEIFIDGNSTNRFLKLFNQLQNENEIDLTIANEHDVDITFKWATDKRIRCFSFNQSIIDQNGHKKWFLNKIKHVNCVYFIAQKAGQNIGSIRFDIEDGVSVVSYLIDADFHGLGYGVIILKLGIERLIAQENINSIIGYVMPENIPSIKAFEKFGFKKIEHGENYKFIKII